MGFMDSLGHLMMDNNDLHFNKTPQAPLTPEEQWLVTLSAPLSAFNGNFVDSIETGEKPETLRAGVAEMWGITDRPSFRKTFERTSQIGQRTKFQHIWDTILKVEKVRSEVPTWMKLLGNFAPFLIPMQINKKIDLGELSRQTEYSESDLRKIIPNLVTDDNWFSDLSSTFKKSFSMSIYDVKSLVAWDAVRLVSISRWAVDLGFIDRNEFVRFAGVLADEVRNSYSSWKEVSAAYIVGGLIWQAGTARRENLVRTNLLLIKDKKEKSPYFKVPFK